MEKGIKRLSNKNQKRLRGSIINLSRAVPRCLRMKCPYAIYTNASLKTLAFICVDLEINLPELPLNIARQVEKYRCTKKLLEYYGNQLMPKSTNSPIA